MDLGKVHSVLTSRGYGYFEGKTNNSGDVIYVDYSTAEGRRGNVVQLAIGRGKSTCKIQLSDGTFKMAEGVGDKKLIKILNTET